MPGRSGYKIYVWGDKFLTLLVNFFYKSNLTDTYTGYKLINVELLKSLGLESRGFEFEMEIVTKVLNKGIKIKEVAITYFPRTHREGKKLTPIDGLKGFLILFRNLTRF